MINMKDYALSGKNILVTGGTGFFGQKIVEVLLKYHSPKKVVVYSRDEYKQHVLSTKLSLVDHSNLRYFIGDVRDEARLKMGMRGIDCVIHSAAMKQVMAAEYNPLECIATNITGAENIVSAALSNNVERVIALSTDKAANPIKHHIQNPISSPVHAAGLRYAAHSVTYCSQGLLRYWIRAL